LTLGASAELLEAIHLCRKSQRGLLAPLAMTALKDAHEKSAPLFAARFFFISGVRPPKRPGIGYARG